MFFLILIPCALLNWLARHIVVVIFLEVSVVLTVKTSVTTL